ncbi:hypothetical protein ACMUMQ_09285 [Marinomonas sp. 2405UD66-6]|uniref:hypothetical protein n=1 Tax=Marinomonas sp. 2405UD66-6 TaxID=3391834 RepID=UPI0039C9E6BC
MLYFIARCSIALRETEQYKRAKLGGFTCYYAIPISPYKINQDRHNIDHKRHQFI